MIPALLSLLSLVLTLLGAAPAPAAEAPPPAPTVAPAATLEPAPAPDGRATFSFPVRDGVSGDCASVRIVTAGQPGAYHRGCWPGGPHREGPARVTVDLRGGRVVACRLQVGGCVAPRGATDLGEVGGAGAAAWLLARVPAMDGEAAEEALAAVGVARDAEPGPGLAALVRNRALDPELREDALHWLATAAAVEVFAAAADILADPDEDAELRESAVFALAHRGGEAALAKLLELGRAQDDPRLRCAVFHALTRFDDPRVVALLEQVAVGE